jgi:putative oxidoreductase
MAQTIQTSAPAQLHTGASIRSALAALLRTDASSSVLLVQRIALGAVMFPHGAQKLLGWFGGPGFQATMQSFTDKMHIPAPLALLVILCESIGSVMLVFGLLSRVCALGMTSIMLVAIATVHWHNGFFMNWMGNQAGEGFEYHLLVLALSIPILFAGGGAWSLDTSLARGLQTPKTTARFE